MGSCHELVWFSSLGSALWRLKTCRFRDWVGSRWYPCGSFGWNKFPWNFCINIKPLPPKNLPPPRNLEFCQLFGQTFVRRQKSKKSWLICREKSTSSKKAFERFCAVSIRLHSLCWTWGFTMRIRFLSVLLSSCFSLRELAASFSYWSFAGNVAVAYSRYCFPISFPSLCWMRKSRCFLFSFVDIPDTFMTFMKHLLCLVEPWDILNKYPL